LVASGVAFVALFSMCGLINFKKFVWLDQFWKHAS